MKIKKTVEELKSYMASLRGGRAGGASPSRTSNRGSPAVQSKRKNTVSYASYTPLSQGGSTPSTGVSIPGVGSGGRDDSVGGAIGYSAADSMRTMESIESLY